MGCRPLVQHARTIRHRARTAKNVWSPVYVDAMVLRDRDADLDDETGDFGQPGSGLEERLYVQTDANFNVTSLIDTAGDVVERFLYDPYGTFTVHDPNWTLDAGGSDFGWVHLHQGGRYDATTGLYHFRFRDYDPELGRWINPDPAGYVDGANLYQVVLSAPVSRRDPGGLTTYIWLEGGSGNEPQPHLGVCIGDPLGKYRTFSFALSGSAWMLPFGADGKVYEEDQLGGPIISAHFYELDPTVALNLIKTLEQESLYPRIQTYTLAGSNCRVWSLNLINAVPGKTPATPPQREPAGGSGGTSYSDATTRGSNSATTTTTTTTTTIAKATPIALAFMLMMFGLGLTTTTANEPQPEDVR